MGQLNLQIPQIGQPDSTEDPKVASNFTAVQAMVNGGLDQSNIAVGAALLGLSPLTVGVSTAAVSGSLYRVTATATITLPAHSAGQVVGVINTAAGITTVSGTRILGVGLALASSFPLGTPGAAAILVDDGTNWNIVAGQQDSGWVLLTLATNFTSSIGTGQYVAAARLQGDKVSLCGNIGNNTGSPTTNGQQWATVPTGLRPAEAVYESAANAGGVYPISVSTLGAVQVYAIIPQTTLIDFDSVSYRLS